MLDATTVKLNSEFIHHIKTLVEPQEWKAKSYNGLELLLDFCMKWKEKNDINTYEDLNKIFVYIEAMKKGLRTHQTARAIQYWIEANSYDLEIKVNREYLLLQVKRQSKNRNLF